MKRRGTVADDAGQGARARRAFVAAAASALLAARMPAFAQRAESVRVALIEAGAPSANQHFVDAFRAGLAALGYVEGRNLTLDVRWAEGQAERFARHFAEVVPLRPDVIVVASALGAIEARKAITSIPVVFVGAADPVDNRIVSSLAHPGGNMTGIARDFGEGLFGKALQALKEIVPAAARIAVLYNSAGEVDLRAGQAAAAARTLAMSTLPVPIREPRDFDRAFARMRGERVDAVAVVTDPLTLQHRDRITGLAAAERMPAVCEFAEFARAGALIAYSADIAALFARAATYVDRIVKGARPGDLAVEQPTKFVLAINVRTARVLGLTVPQSLLLRADEVIG